jgi:hypothetical protein
LSATKISADDGIQSLTSESRNCYFEDEVGTLKVHKKYSQINCMLECNLNYAKETMKVNYNLTNYCTPWYFPSHEDNIIICDPWKTVIFMKFFTSVPDDNCPQCLPGISSFGFGFKGFHHYLLIFQTNLF